MKRILITLVVLLLVLSPLTFAQEAEETEKVEETETVELEAPDGIEEFVVKKLPYGVEVLLEPDKPIRRSWSKSFTFDIDYNYEEETSYATTGFWFGNGITSYWLTYSRDVHTEDPGRVSFSFNWTF